MQGDRHRKECRVLESMPKPKGVCDTQSKVYSAIAPLRVLLRSREEGSESWRRVDQLMDHEEERRKNEGEWQWFQENVVEFLST